MRKRHLSLRERDRDRDRQRQRETEREAQRRDIFNNGNSYNINNQKVTKSLYIVTI